jgi:hypothetical protein
MWDDRDVLNKKLSQTMEKYTCKMNHVSLHEPQSQVKHWWDSRDKFATKELVVRSPIRSPRRSLKKSFHRKWRKVILEQCKSAAAKVSENYENAIRKQEEIRQKYLRSLEKVKKYSDEAKYLRRQVKTLRSRLSLTVEESAPTSLSSRVASAINRLVKLHYSKYGIKRLGKEIADAVWSPECLNGILRDPLIGTVKKYLRQDVFNPRNIVRAMDLFGGMLSFQSIRVLRWIEGDGNPYNRSLMIPSVGVLQRYLANFTAFCSTKLKCSFFQTDSGEGFEFDEKEISISHLEGYKEGSTCKGSVYICSHHNRWCEGYKKS